MIGQLGMMSAGNLSYKGSDWMSTKVSRPLRKHWSPDREFCNLNGQPRNSKESPDHKTFRLDASRR